MPSLPRLPDRPRGASHQHDARDDGIIDLRSHTLRIRGRFASLAAFEVLGLLDTLHKGPDRLRSLGPLTRSIPPRCF